MKIVVGVSPFRQCDLVEYFSEVVGQLTKRFETLS